MFPVVVYKRFEQKLATVSRRKSMQYCNCQMKLPNESVKLRK